MLPRVELNKRQRTQLSLALSPDNPEKQYGRREFATIEVTHQGLKLNGLWLRKNGKFDVYPELLKKPRCHG